MPCAPRLRHQRHVLEDTLDLSLPLDVPQQPEGRSSGSAADVAEQPAAGSVQARDSGPSIEPQPGQASAQAHKPNNAMALGVTEATLEYTVAEAAGDPCQPGGPLQAEQPDQAVRDRQRQAAGQQAVVGSPSTQEPHQAAGAWTPLSPQEGWRTKHKIQTPEAFPAAKPQGEHWPSSIPHCPDSSRHALFPYMSRQLQKIMTRSPLRTGACPTWGTKLFCYHLSSCPLLASGHACEIQCMPTGRLPLTHFSTCRGASRGWQGR